MTAGEQEHTRQYILRLDRARATLAEEVEPDVAPVRDLSLEERGQLVARLCASAWAILRSRGDFPRQIEHRDPPAPDYPEKWRAMNARFRATTAASGNDG
jgi:hypothetical protein